MVCKNSDFEAQRDYLGYQRIISFWNIHTVAQRFYCRLVCPHGSNEPIYTRNRRRRTRARVFFAIRSLLWPYSGHAQVRSRRPNSRDAQSRRERQHE
jgi:hypothetical protein